MGLVVYWYDVFCFGIVGVAIFVSIWLLLTKERCLSIYGSDTTLLLPMLDSYHGPAALSSSRLWSSCWRGLHPAWLFGFRVISFFMLSGFLSWDLHDWGLSIFIYYTEWTFALVMVYFAIGSVISAYGCWLYYSKDDRSLCIEESGVDGNIEENRRTRVSIGKGDGNYYQDQAGFWGYLMQTAYQICTGAVILTDIVFWGIIVPLLSNARLGLNLLMGCMHTMNIILLLIDTSINQLPFPWFRIAYFVAWSSTYVVFQWVIHLLGFSWWPYPFLELSTPSAPLWYIILAVFHIVCYGMYTLIVKMKDSIFSRVFPNSYIRSY